jgi:hypothetical protein
LNGTRFLICCRGHHVQTSLGVTRVVLVLVILRHCHAPLPDNSIQTGNLSRIVEVSLFKTDHSQTQKGPLTWKRASIRKPDETSNAGARRPCCEGVVSGRSQRASTRVRSLSMISRHATSCPQPVSHLTVGDQEYRLSLRKHPIAHPFKDLSLGKRLTGSSLSPPHARSTN